MSEREVGQVESSTSALVEAMGDLLPWERVTAGQALALARAIDLEEDGSKLASLSRELRQLTSVLARVGEGRASAPQEAGTQEAAPAEDPIAGLADEVARKRAERRRA